MPSVKWIRILFTFPYLIAPHHLLWNKNKQAKTRKLNPTSVHLLEIKWLCMWLFFSIFKIFKLFIEFVIILLVFYVLIFWPRGTWDLSSLIRDQSHTPSIGGQSLNHWTTWEVPALLDSVLSHLSICLSMYLGYTHCWSL